MIIEEEGIDLKKKYKIFLWLIVYFILAAIAFYVYFNYIKSRQVESLPPVNEVKVTNVIDKYGYTLEDRDTDLFKEKFDNLKELLELESYDKEEYIKLVSELFIIDFYTIDNKISRYDVGGLEYVYNEAISSFKSVAENSIYKKVENNLDDTRTQSLPVVSQIAVDTIEKTNYIMPDESTREGYTVKLHWSYVTDLGYDTSGVLILIPDGNKYGVVFYKQKN